MPIQRIFKINEKFKSLAKKKKIKITWQLKKRINQTRRFNTIPSGHEEIFFLAELFGTS